MSSLRYARRRFHEINYTPRKAVDVLYYNMVAHHKDHKVIIEKLIEIVQDSLAKTKLAEIRELYGLAKRAAEISIDCAHKLAPYQAPKLESIEVKSQVEHKFVMRSPKKVANVEDWAKLTGADKLNYKHSEHIKKNIQPPAPSLHDFDEDEDEIKTHKELH